MSSPLLFCYSNNYSDSCWFYYWSNQQYYIENSIKCHRLCSKKNILAVVCTYKLDIDFRSKFLIKGRGNLVILFQFLLTEMSEELLQYFVDPKTLQHSGGHFIPVSGPQKKVYLEFLQPYLDRKKDQQKIWLRCNLYYTCIHWLWIKNHNRVILVKNKMLYMLDDEAIWEYCINNTCPLLMLPLFDGCNLR